MTILRKLLITPLICLPALAAHAGTMGEHKAAGYPVVSLGIGTATPANLGQAEYFPILDPITDEFYSYLPNYRSKTAPLFSMMVGAEFPINPLWLFQTGIEYNARGTFKVNGNFLQGADVQSADNYSYEYQLSSTQVLLDAKLLYTVKEFIHPFVIGGLGTAFNKAYHFASSVPPTLTFTRNFPDNTRTSFSYILGLGVEADITKKLRAGIGYRYAGLGKYRFGDTTINTTSVTGTLSQANVHSNEVLLQLTWLFN